jgi:hypothetical protein
MPYRIDGICMQVIVLREVVQVFFTDHGLNQQSASICFQHDPSEPIERWAEYELVFQRKVRRNGEGRKTP